MIERNASVEINLQRRLRILRKIEQQIVRASEARDLGWRGERGIWGGAADDRRGRQRGEYERRFVISNAFEHRKGHRRGEGGGHRRSCSLQKYCSCYYCRCRCRHRRLKSGCIATDVVIFWDPVRVPGIKASISLLKVRDTRHEFCYFCCMV